MNIEKMIQSKFLKAKDSKVGDVVTFLDEGEIKEFPNGDKALNFTVDVNGEEKIYSPNKTNLSILAQHWGTETSNYINKQATISFMKVRNPQDGQLVDSIALQPMKDEAGAEKIAMDDIPL